MSPSNLIAQNDIDIDIDNSEIPCDDEFCQIP
jgi:hypothetical protein